MSSCGYRARQKCFCDFGPFFALSPHFWPWKLKSGKNVNKTFKITHVYHKWRSHDLCFLRYKAQQSFLSFWGNFCPLTLLTTWKIKILKKWNKNTWRYYHFTLKCIIDNDNHMMYGSWDMKRNRQKFLPFWAIFCPFTPLTTQKIKILKKKKWKKQKQNKNKKNKTKKTHLTISSFYKSVPKIMIICYVVPEIWHVMNIIVILHFGYLIPF